MRPPSRTARAGVELPSLGTVAAAARCGRRGAGRHAKISFPPRVWEPRRAASVFDVGAPVGAELPTLPLAEGAAPAAGPYPSFGGGRSTAERRTRRRPRRLDGVSVVRSCARPRGDARAVAAAAPSPRVDAASCRGRPYRPGVGCRVFSARRLGGGRAVAPHERPARMMGGSASEQRPRERHRRDIVLVTASARWRAMSERTRESPPAPDHRPRPRPRSGRARRDEAGGLQPRGLCG